jgi:guanylate kinase
MLNEKIFKEIINKYKKERGLIVVISAPTAVGKTTVCEELMKKDKNILRSISFTTRQPRDKEINKKDYYFVSKAEFLRLKTKNFFLESKKVHNNYYGTPKKFVIDNIKKNKVVVLTIDVKGGLEVKRKFKDTVLIFLLPPSLNAMLKRMYKRGTESLKEAKIRLRTANEELKKIPKYDYLVINDKLENAVDEIKAIIIAEKNKIK